METSNQTLVLSDPSPSLGRPQVAANLTPKKGRQIAIEPNPYRAVLKNIVGIKDITGNLSYDAKPGRKMLPKSAMVLAILLAKARLYTGYSVRSVETECGVNYVSLYNLESGKTGLRGEPLQRLCDWLGIDKDELLALDSA